MHKNVSRAAIAQMVDGPPTHASAAILGSVLITKENRLARFSGSVSHRPDSAFESVSLHECSCTIQAGARWCRLEEGLAKLLGAASLRSDRAIARQAANKEDA